MNENTNEKLTEANISTNEFLAKVEEAAREGAKQGSKGAGRGIENPVLWNRNSGSS